MDQFPFNGRAEFFLCDYACHANCQDDCKRITGPKAPNAVESVIPGIAVGAFVDDRKSGRFLHAQHFTGMTLEEAVFKAEDMKASPYTI